MGIDIFVDKRTDRTAICFFTSGNGDSASRFACDPKPVSGQPALNHLQISTDRRLTHLEAAAVIKQFTEFFFLEDLKRQTLPAFFTVADIQTVIHRQILPQFLFFVLAALEPDADSCFGIQGDLISFEDRIDRIHLSLDRALA